jgi:hypothetical protein
MAEAAGLVLGTIALVSLFQDCVDLLSKISAAKSIGRDYAMLNAKLDIEKTLLLHWDFRLSRFSPTAYDSRLDDHETQQIIKQILASIKILLSESDELKRRYSVEPAMQSEALDAVPVRL